MSESCELMFTLDDWSKKLSESLEQECKLDTIGCKKCSQLAIIADSFSGQDLII